MSQNKRLRYVIHALALFNALLMIGALVIGALWAFSDPAWVELFDYRFHKESLFIGLVIGASVTTTVDYRE